MWKRRLGLVWVTQISTNFFSPQREYDGRKRPYKKEPNDLHINNIPSFTDKATIVEYFSTFGEINRIVMPYTKYLLRHKGYAFVSFVKTEAMEKVLNTQHEVSFRNKCCNVCMYLCIYIPRSAAEGRS